jgi:bifunctional oligoribonuclease and PAP phosphatase NrnA
LSTQTRELGKWTSNASAREMAESLRGAKRAVVLTHAKPDGDAIGSSVAIARAMSTGGTKVEAWYVGPCPRWTKEMAAGIPVREFKPGEGLSGVEQEEFDAVVVVDTGSWTQLAEAKSFLQARRERVFLFDHHLHGDAEVSDRRLIMTAAASCTQVLAPVCAELVGAATAAKLPLTIAEPLFLGLATDTGWLRFSNVSPATLRLAADLIEAGVDHTKLYRLIEQQDHAARWQLFGRALRTLHVHGGGRIATMLLTLKDFDETGATANDTSGFADMVLTIASVELSAVLVETANSGGPLTKISLRSKPGAHAIDVNELASRLGGGGHARAAGAKIHQAPADAVKTLVEAVK